MSKKPTVTTVATPTGERIGNAIGPGHLNLGAGKACVKAGKAIFCGHIVGTAFGFTEHPNSKDPSKVSIRFAGDFVFVKADGERSAHTECYMPSVINNGLRASLSLPNSTGVDVALEVWAEPDEITGRETATGYVYAAYNRMRRDPSQSRALRLAAETGILDIPEFKTLAAPVDPNIDPETGEVLG